MRIATYFLRSAVVFMFGVLAGCASGPHVYVDENMDFGAIETVAVMPFANFTRDNVSAERVRDVFINKLLATGAIYVLPVGEVARGVGKMEMANPSTPSQEEVIKLGGIIKAQAVITGAVREYGEMRSGSTAANVISVSAQMMETQTGRVVWSSSSSQGGIGLSDRLLGGGGQPMEIVTEKAVDDLIKKLFGTSSPEKEKGPPSASPSSPKSEKGRSDSKKSVPEGRK